MFPRSLAPAILAVQGEVPDRVVRLDGNPTAELLTREAWNAIERALPAHVSLERVGVQETPMCGAFLTRKPA